MSRFSIILFLLSFQLSNSQWEPCNNGLTGVNVNAILVNENKIYAGTHGGGFFMSSDNGNNWIPRNDGLLDTTVVSIGFSENIIFAGTRNAGMYLSTDNGESWTEKNNGLTLNSIWSIAVDGKNIYAGTRDSGIFLSTDMGDNWTQINNQLIYVRSLLAAGGEVFAGTYNSGMYVSTDQGKSWAERNNGLDDIDVRCLAMKGNDMFAGTSALGIFHTTDKGLNWHNEIIGTSKYGSVWAFAYSGENLFLGSYDRGVYLSTDNGTSWVEKNQGIKDTSVSKLAVSDNYIFAETNNTIYRAKLSEMITGINEEKNEKNTSLISPNPATDFIEILVGTQLAVSEQNEVRIYNVFGQTAATSAGGGQRIDVSGLVSGMYFVQIGDKLRKFVKI